MIIDKISNKTGKYTALLISLLVALILYPALEQHEIGKICLTLWCLMTMVTMLYSLNDNKIRLKRIKIASSILFLLIGLLVIHQSLGFEQLYLYLLILPSSIAFAGYVTWVILSSIFRKNKIGADELSGAIVSYLLLGIMWGLLYSLIELISPNSFSFVHANDIQAKGASLFYYSFVTLTTLGYGDILPINRFARMAAYLEAVVGVMYTAILVAGLVGHIGSHKKHD